MWGFGVWGVWRGGVVRCDVYERGVMCGCVYVCWGRVVCRGVMPVGVCGCRGV